MMLYTALFTLLYALVYLIKKTGRIPTVVLLLIISQPLVAQQQWKLAYFGETITHYGFRLGWDSHLNRHLYWGASVSAYRHPGNHLGALLMPEIGWRHTGKHGLLVQAALGLGGYRSIYEGSTYEPRPEGGFKKIPLAGQWGLMPGISIGGGYNFLPKKNTPWKLYFNIHYLRQYPYNQRFLQKAALEVGVAKILSKSHSI